MSEPVTHHQGDRPDGSGQEESKPTKAFARTDGAGVNVIGSVRRDLSERGVEQRRGAERASQSRDARLDETVRGSRRWLRRYGDVVALQVAGSGIGGSVRVTSSTDRMPKRSVAARSTLQADPSKGRAHTCARRGRSRAHSRSGSRSHLGRWSARDSERGFDVG